MSDKICLKTLVSSEKIELLPATQIISKGKMYRYIGSTVIL